MKRMDGRRPVGVVRCAVVCVGIVEQARTNVRARSNVDASAVHGESAILSPLATITSATTRPRPRPMVDALNVSFPPRWVSSPPGAAAAARSEGARARACGVRDCLPRATAARPRQQREGEERRHRWSAPRLSPPRVTVSVLFEFWRENSNSNRTSRGLGGGIPEGEKGRPVIVTHDDERNNDVRMNRETRATTGKDQLTVIVPRGITTTHRAKPCARPCRAARRRTRRCRPSRA